MTPRGAAEACAGRYHALADLLDRALDNARREGLADPLPSALQLAGATDAEARAIVGAVREAFAGDEDRVWRWLFEAHPPALEGRATPVEAIRNGLAARVIAEITRLEHGVFS
jgi:hypothetical protein